MKRRAASLIISNTIRSDSMEEATALANKVGIISKQMLGALNSISGWKFALI